VRHEEAFKRLPDLLDDRDNAGLLAHVGSCADCQRQLFLLGRVDRMLRDSASAQGVGGRRWPSVRNLLAASAVTAAAAGAALALFLPQAAHPHQFVLRTASGRSVGQAVMGRSDARNASLALTARGMPVARGHMFVLWAGDDRSSMQVGRFMVDRTGGCRARFNVPASHAWSRFWVTELGTPGAVVAKST
jgi:hypothetical protein